MKPRRALLALVTLAFALLGALSPAHAAQVQHLASQTATATGSGPTGTPSIASFNVPSGKNRVLFIWAAFERDHCSPADASAGRCLTSNTAGTGLGDNWPEARTGTPPATTSTNQITARVVGPATTINKKNALTLAGTPSGDLRFFTVSSSPQGSPSGTAYYSLTSFHVALFENEIQALLGGAASGSVSINLPDVVNPTNAGDDAILIVSAFQNVEQSPWGMVRNATASAQLTVAGPPTYTPGNYTMTLPAYDGSPGAPAPAQTPDEADDGKLLMPLSATTEGFLTPAGHTALAAASTTNAAGTWDTPNSSYAMNEPNGASAAAFFRNGGATPGSGATVTSAAPSSVQTYGGLMASFLLESDNADMSDAPASYGTASHALSGIRLGASVDADATLLASSDATGDDADGTDDENGVTVPALYTGQAATVPVSVQGAAGFLSAWFDWNGDGDFLDAGEQVASGQSAAVGTTNLTVTPPATAPGTVFARFRVCTTASDCAAPAGTAQSGEVEDYKVTVTPVVSASGTVWRDADGSVTNNGETGTDAGGLTVYAVDAGGTVIAKASVAANGAYTIGGIPQNSSVTLRLSSNAGVAVGNPAPAPGLPAGWANTGENAGGTPETATPGEIALTTGTSDLTGQDFGIEQTPTATGGSATSASSTGGSANVPPAIMAGSDPDGTVAQYTITAIPADATSITVGGIVYDAGNPIPPGGASVPAAPSGALPAGAVAVLPKPNVVSVAIPFTVTDAAGKTSSPATATVVASITGSVWLDANENQVKDATEAATTGGSSTLTVYLVSAGVVVDKTAVGSTGFRFFGVAPGTYTLILSNNPSVAVGAPAPAPSLPAGYGSTAENAGDPATATPDGTTDGQITVTVP